ncbi:hypothetical protein GIB67_008940 [Kingdonia uniflora]|uniref:Uncharacterized protein n=1 Tax=Kingdonia uniflora TaxID=39325 RepID=A0A7J7LVR3_9MAGN|nr:hypothetical protein GIB67_008940 [Kingdonia uniflora]
MPKEMVNYADKRMKKDLKESDGLSLSYGAFFGLALSYYYPVGSYVAPPSPPPMYYGKDHYFYASPPMQSPRPRVGDYFSDENAIGYPIM